MWNSILDTFGPLTQVSCGKLRTAGFVRFCGLCLMFGLFTWVSLPAQGPEGNSSEGGRRTEDRSGRRGRGGGGRGSFDPAQMVSRLDQDQNGIITESEIERVPAFIRDSWQQQGLDFSKGVRVEDLQQNAQRGMEEMRRQREEGGGGRPADFERSDRPEFTPQDPAANGGTGSGASPPAGKPPATGAGNQSTTQKSSRSRVSPLLPGSFQAFDTDLDGQIALYEWRKGKRGPLSQFAQYDLDGDGFLIAKELAKAVASGAAATPAVPPAAGVTAASTVATTAPASTAAPPVLAQVAVSVDAALKATRAFELLDKDKSGTVVGAEWAESKRLKPLFEKGGYDLAKPMTKDEFTQGYVRVGAVK